MEGSHLSFLRCREIITSLDDENLDDGSESYDNDYIQTLLEREIASCELRNQPDSWIQRARSDGINYILTKREILGFGFQTAYVSVTYLDRYLSKRSIEEDKWWLIRLVSMACLSLGAKMEETRVPPLPDFCVQDYYFESSAIHKMELLVLNALEWKMGPVTPFDFIHFFAHKFSDNPVPRNSLPAIVDVILDATKDVTIMCHKPSVIAAATTLVVLDHGLTRDVLEIKITSLNPPYSLEIENVIYCYNVLKEMDIEGIKLSKGIGTSPGLSPIQIKPNGSSIPAGSAKRKRLVFDQSDGAQKMKKP